MTKNQNVKYSIVIFLFLLSIAYFLWKVGVFDVSDKNVNEIDIIHNANQTLSSNHSVDQTQPIITLKPLTENFNPPSYIGLYYRGTCGENVDKFEADVAKAKKARSKRKYIEYGKDFSEIQLKAINGVKVRCNQWYDFIGSLSDDDLEKYKSQIQEAKELNQYFKNGNDIPHKTKLLTARSMVQSGENDGTGFSSDALRYLLSKDYKFLLRIAKELNIEGVEFIRPNISNIVSLYNCSINFESECAPNSMSMMSTCFLYPDESTCGVSFNQYIATRTTPNNYADLENIISIIKQLIREGYFDQYLE